MMKSKMDDREIKEGIEKRVTAGVIVAHGELATELVRTIELIVGRVESLHPISGSDLSDEDVVDSIKGIISKYSGEGVLIFVDYFGGSCCTNALKAAHGLKDVKVISGVNLPVLLDFVTKRNRYEINELIEHIVLRGRESVRVVDF